MGTLSLAVERREERVDAAMPGFAVTERNTNSVTGVWQLRHEDHALQANLRHDRSDQFGGETTGAIAWGWRFAPEWRVTASYGTAFKPPSFNDLYFPGFSNPTLAPETSRNVEAGVYWNRAASATRSVEARAVGWHNRVDDLIVFQCDADFNCLPQNVDRRDARRRDARPRRALAATRRCKASLDLQDPEDDATGQLLPRRARAARRVALAQRLGPVRLGVEVDRVVAPLRRRREPAPAGRLRDREPDGRMAGRQGRDAVRARRQRRSTATTCSPPASRRRGAQVFAGVRWQP